MSIAKKIGFSKRSKRQYEICNNVTDTAIFSSTVTGDSSTINNSLNCDDKCLVYCATCKHFNDQCTGKTTYDFQYME